MEAVQVPARSSSVCRAAEVCAGTLGEAGEPGTCSGSLRGPFYSAFAVLVPNGLRSTTGNAAKVLSQSILKPLADVGHSCLEWSCRSLPSEHKCVSAF